MSKELLLDVRGLEAPQPLEQVLEQAAQLLPGQQLRVIHFREPCLLYPLLKKRGFAHRTLVDDDNHFEFLVWKENGNG
ncbi:MAG: DUF2249 domain-containing protein [Sulfuricella sp.]|nr:DUF2249 domain-containing protein [Sulfuricella sp.]